MAGYSAVTREVRESWVGTWQPAIIGAWTAADLRKIVADLDTNAVPADAPITFRSRRSERLPVHDIVTVAGETRAIAVPTGAIIPSEDVAEEPSDG
jgi:hypothetical protein